MAEASIPIDLFNPGQVFACLGFVEAADALMGDAEGAFDWTDATSTRFALRANGEVNPVGRVLQFLGEAQVVAVAPGARSPDGWLPSWGPIEQLRDGDPYPFAKPSSPAMFVAELRAPGQTLAIDHWGDSTRRDSVKFWAGSRGYPGSAIARDAIDLVRSRLSSAVEDPFSLAAPQSSSFRFDWRRDYIPIDAGFSLNEHEDIETVGYPLVELLAAVGLANARPARIDPRDKLKYRYGVVGRDPGAPSEWYSPALLRAALGGGLPPFPSRRFVISLGWPGQENQARSIITVTEEPVP